MARRVARLTLDNLSDLPLGCASCAFWELDAVRRQWAVVRPQAPSVAGFVDDDMAWLETEIDGFAGKGLVAAHNDICNANWLLTPDDRWYLVDLEAMAWDDPGCPREPLRSLRCSTTGIAPLHRRCSACRRWR